MFWFRVRRFVLDLILLCTITLLARDLILLNRFFVCELKHLLLGGLHVLFMISFFIFAITICSESSKVGY